MHRARPCLADRLLAAAVLVMAGCSAPAGPTPSLAPRAAEAIDPRAPVVAATAPQPIDGALAVRLGELVSLARQGESAFIAAAAMPTSSLRRRGLRSPKADRRAKALSAAVATRAPAARALGDIDALTQSQLVRYGGIGPADLAAIQAAAADVAAIERRQAETIEALQSRLGG